LEEAPAAVAGVPAYLAGRFGADAVLVTLIPDEPRRLETGALVYRGPDEADPRTALGVVLRPRDEGDALALVARTAPPRLMVRDHGREVAVRLEPLPG